MQGRALGLAVGSQPGTGGAGGGAGCWEPPIRKLIASARLWTPGRSSALAAHLLGVEAPPRPPGDLSALASGAEASKPLLLQQP